MSYGFIFHCDVCGTSKGAGNKWLMGVVHSANERNQSIQTPGAFKTPSIEIMQWDDTASRGSIRHFCGETCLQKELSKFLVRG